MLKFTALLFIGIAASGVLRAADLTADEKAFFNQHISDVIRVEPAKIDDPAVMKAFATTFYAAKLIIKSADGDETTDFILARVGDGMVNVTRPGTDADLPDVLKMLKPDFKLATDNDAKALQEALDKIYPIAGADDQKAEGILHSGTKWSFVRGNFFQDKMGFVFETNADGTIKSVRYVLKLGE